MMQTKNHQCSPYHLETAKNLVQEGAYEYGTAYRISIPLEQALVSSDQKPSIGTKSPLLIEKTRNPPVIWEARRELVRRGCIAAVVRSGNDTLFDLIACDRRIFYLIAVRRVRTRGELRDISTRFDPLISELRTLSLPSQTEIQLWIRSCHSFQIYEVLTGGIIRRNLP
ncbi:MAG: hypothetical protein V1862_11335 [Methanobacteriota archaeon]